MERKYNIPLRRKTGSTPSWKKAKKAVSSVRVFLQKHMKAEDVLLGQHLNRHIWKDGVSNIPHHVEIVAIKDDEGVVRAELVGKKYIEPTQEERDEKSGKGVENKLATVAAKAGIKIPKSKKEKASVEESEVKKEETAEKTEEKKVKEKVNIEKKKEEEIVKTEEKKDESTSNKE